MAAGQQKKRLTSSNFHEQCRGKKKKKVDSSDYILNLTSHIDLEWNDKQKRAVAKKEQIGVSWMDMAPFIDSFSQPHFGVADVISVPPEIFSLKNLNEVLSYEVWATCLSESDRKLLAQFLPTGRAAKQVVHELLEGNNHHFGNPFIKWSTLLQAGNLHPDVVLGKEKQFRAKKRAYYYELKKYHTSLLEILIKWKEKWLSVKDPEKLLSDVYAKNKQGLIATPSERATDTNALKKETPTRNNMHNDATDEYLSYIKISRAQHNLIKKMKQSGDDIQSKSLINVLGDIKCFPLQPYESFVEEEKQQLHEYWLELVNKDLPKAFEIQRDRKSQREEWKRYLEQELAEKKISLVEEDMNTENLESFPQGDESDHTPQSASNVEDENDCDSKNNSEDDPMLGESTRNSEDEQMLGDSTHNSEDDQMLGDSTHNSEDDQMLCGTSFNNKQEYSSLIIQEESTSKEYFQEESKETAVKLDDDFPPISQSLSQSHYNNIMEPLGSLLSTKDTWKVATLCDSNYHSSPNNHGLKSELSLSQPQFHQEHSAQVIDLGRDVIKPEAQTSPKPSFDGDIEAPLFCSFSNQDQNDILPSFPKGPEMLQYPREHMNGARPSGLPFLMTNDSLPQPTQFPNQFQQQLLEQREAMNEKDLYVNQNMNKSLYSPGKYPSQGHFPSDDQQSFAAVQPSMSNSSVGYNWLPGENQADNSWSRVDPLSSGHCVGNGNSDGSLYSVLNKKVPPYSPDAEQYAQVRNFTRGVVPNAQNIYGYAPQQLNNLGLHHATGAPSNGGSWMNVPHQNPTLHDSLGSYF